MGGRRLLLRVLLHQAPYQDKWAVFADNGVLRVRTVAMVKPVIFFDGRCPDGRCPSVLRSLRVLLDSMSPWRILRFLRRRKRGSGCGIGQRRARRIPRVVQWFSCERAANIPRGIGKT